MQRIILRVLAGVFLVLLIVFLVHYQVGFLGGDELGFTISPRGAIPATTEGESPLDRDDDGSVSCVVQMVDKGAVKVRLHMDKGGLYFAVRRPSASETAAAAASEEPLTIFDGNWFKLSFDSLIDQRRAVALLLYYLGVEFAADEDLSEIAPAAETD